MINNVTLVGRLVAPPDLRKTPNNISSLQGTLAVNRNFKNENGDREADFINFQAWRGTADIIAQYCSKGSLIGIIGRIQVRSYEKDGQIALHDVGKFYSLNPRIEVEVEVMEPLSI